jgi:hypothetical protein
VAAASALGEPAEHWQNADPAAGLSAQGLKAVQDFGNAAKPTTVMFVQDGRIVAGFWRCKPQVQHVFGSQEPF